MDCSIKIFARRCEYYRVFFITEERSVSLFFSPDLKTVVFEFGDFNVSDMRYISYEELEEKALRKFIREWGPELLLKIERCQHDDLHRTPR